MSLKDTIYEQNILQKVQYRFKELDTLATQNNRKLVFDIVWQDAHIYKLDKAKILLQLIKIIQSSLSDRRLKLRVGDIVSKG